MNLYLNYAREHWTNPDENPPIGLILCSEHDAAVALRAGQFRKPGACAGIPTYVAERRTTDSTPAGTPTTN